MPADDPDAPAFSLDARLAALADYAILDTPEEAGFDDIVKLAALICQTPVALVSLVEKDRQWFKARVGFEGCETPIEQSVCQHALRQHELLVIPDLTLDPRTSANTLVTHDPFIRFYAGAPLVTPSGMVIGTLCVIDQVPRPEGLSAEQAEALAALARQVMVQLELRKTLLASKDGAADDRASRDLVLGERNRHVLAEEAGGIGTFELDIASGRMAVSAQYCRLFGLPIAATHHASESEALVVRDDSGIMSNDRSRKDGSAPLNVEYRIRRGDTGEVRWLSRSASFVKDAQGRPVTMFGTVYDVTDRHRLLDQQERLLQLGDEFRDAVTGAEIAGLAARALGEVLRVDRAGYGRVDWRAGTFTVESDWSTNGLPSISGEHLVERFAITAQRLANGETLAIANIPGAHWLRDDLPGYARAGTAAMIDIPLVDHGELVGIAYVHHTRPRTWRQDEVDFAHAVADRTHSALAKLDAEAGQELLNRELGHRMKNQLALVQAIVGQTLRSSDNIAAAGEVLRSRIQVLANAHDILLNGVVGRTTVADIVRQAVLLHDDRLESRFSITGPNVVVASRPALSLSLILHELSTNAAKYGALSSEHGTVNISWTIERNEQGAFFVFHWMESGGPLVSEPDRKGAGSRLIRAGLSGVAGGSVTVDYAAEGLRCKVVAELTSFQTER